MRVIAGIHKGRRLKSPPKSAIVRPTTDRVKETLFNILNNIVDYSESDFVDLFFGTGAIGIEFLSRGGKSATFVDKDTKLVKENLELIQQTNDYEIIRNDALKYILSQTGHFDVGFADPPYNFLKYDDLIESAKSKISLFIIEHSSDIDLKGGYMSKDFGDTSMTFFNFKED